MQCETVGLSMIQQLCWRFMIRDHNNIMLLWIPVLSDRLGSSLTLWQWSKSCFCFCSWLRCVPETSEMFSQTRTCLGWGLAILYTRCFYSLHDCCSYVYYHASLHFPKEEYVIGLAEYSIPPFHEVDSMWFINFVSESAQEHLRIPKLW